MSKRGSDASRSSDNPAQRKRVKSTPLHRTLRGLLFAFLLWAAWGAAFVFTGSIGHVSVIVGEPSPRDIKSPRQVTYVSTVKTQDQRLAAESDVADVYDGPDMDISTTQVKTLRDITNYVTALRHDPFSDREQKLALLYDLPSIMLPSNTWGSILDLGEEDWQGVVTEALRVLDLSMREEIRKDQVSEARQRVRRLTTHTLSTEQQSAAIALAQGMIVPNSFYNAARTTKERQLAKNAVQPVHWTIREGESILREGDIVTDLALEKLQVLGLLDTGREWEDSVGILLLLLLIVVSLSLYIARSHPLLLYRPRRELLLFLILLTIGVTPRFVLPEHTILPYLFPAAAAAMLVAILLDVQLAVLVSIVAAMIVGFVSDGSLELIIYTLFGSMIGALTLWRMDQLGAFIRATLYVAIVNVTVVLGFRLQSHVYDAVGLIQLLGMGCINAILCSSLTFVAFSLIGRVFGITTSLQLLELARPTHPLFRQLLTKAPGTYHHSIIVSNMADRAAEAIGADALLSRVGCYYHDVGKTLRPYFFSENQSDGENPHDKLDPKTSAEIIIAHTTDGLALARRYKLPERVCAFILEHHGTTLVSYFYQRAVQESDGQDVDENDFRYPGPKPQSKETAIVMLADSIEAWVRANRPSTQSEMERVIRQVINDRLIGGQLDECDLTLKDLDTIREAFISVLQGIFHPRIQYPESSTRRNGRRSGTAAVQLRPHPNQGEYADRS